MPHLSVRKTAEQVDQGFTIYEVTIIVVIISILAAIAIPSYLSTVNRNRLNNAMAQLRSALQEAQTEAIRKGIQCQVNINTTTATITASPTSCLITGSRNLTTTSSSVGSNNSTGVSIATNLSGTPPRVTFSYKGTTTNSGVIVLHRTNGTGPMKCLAISNGIGIVRTGNYSGSNPPSSINANSCNTSVQ